MSKIILMSVLLAMIVIPAAAARTSRDPRRGLKRMLTQAVLFFAFYTFALRFLWGRW